MDLLILGKLVCFCLLTLKMQEIFFFLGFWGWGLGFGVNPCFFSKGEASIVVESKNFLNEDSGLYRIERGA